MDPVSFAASVITLVTATRQMLGFLSDVKDAPRQRADFELELATLYSLLISLKNRLDVSNPTSNWHKALRTLGVQNGPLAQYSSVLQEMLRKITGANKVVTAMKWVFTKEDVKVLRSRIESLKSTIHIVLQLDHFELSQTTKDDTQEIRSDTQMIKNDTQQIGSDTQMIKYDTQQIASDTTILKGHAAAIDLKATSIYSAIRQHEYSQKLQSALDWVSSTNYPARQAGLLLEHQAGTGSWFINSPEFGQWRQRPKSTLLCTGIKGAGKTIMAAVVIDELGRTLNLEKHGVAYVFCHYKDRMGEQGMNPLAAMLKQLVQNKPSTAEPLLQLHSQHTNHRSYATATEIRDTLRRTLELYSSAYIVVDALDEFPEKGRRGLCESLRYLQGCCKVAVMVTSRPNPEIIEDFKEAAKVEIRAKSGDVRALAAKEVNDLLKNVRGDTELVKRVLDTISQSADGMFLLARLYLDQLAGAETKREVKNILNRLEKRAGSGDVDTIYREVYSDSIERIQSQHPNRRARAMRALAWVTLAQRPLTTKELCVALAVEEGDEDFDEDNEPDIGRIVSSCVGLITIETTTDCVRFIHYTTQEFFDSVIHSWNLRTSSSRTASQSDLRPIVYVASTCLAFLGFNSIKDGLSESNSEPSPWLDPIPDVGFLGYAYNYWPYHVKNCQEEIAERVLSFLNDGQVMCSVRWTPNGYRWIGDSSNDAEPLHVTAVFGLTHLFERILQATPDDSPLVVNAKDSASCTPLFYAAEAGHVEIVKLLLARRDVDVNEFGYNTNPLLVATANGHIDVVHALLAHGAIDIEARDFWDQGVLFQAVESGSVELVKLFIEEYGIAAHQLNYWGKTPLHVATGISVEVVRYLLGRSDVRRHCLDIGGNTALHAAARSASLGAVELLLESGAFDVNEKNRFGETVLHLPVWRAVGNMDVVERLSRVKGVNIEAKDNEGRTPLEYAVHRCNARIARFLIDERHCDVNTKDNQERSLMVIAAQSWVDSPLLLELLIDRGVDVNEKDSEGRNAVVHAAEVGNWEVLKWLMRRDDVDLDVSDKITSEEGRERFNSLKEELGK